jgi:GTP cyclohydrolase IB
MYLEINGANVQQMPDVASKSQPKVRATLDWVGMAQIKAPVHIINGNDELSQTPASVQVYVNIAREDIKGVHMSRMYLLLEKYSDQETLSASSLKALLTDILETHEGISDNALVEFKFEYFLRRPSLKSDNKGWKAYPMTVRAQVVDGQFGVTIHSEVAYSSTCPCSAALARQLIQQQFEKDFSENTVTREDMLKWLGSEQGIIATPHSQRSIAKVKIGLAPTVERLPLLPMIDQIEGSLKTAVQTAVKREDEQEFALLNGQNLMFCEDAARRIKQALNAHNDYIDFCLRVEHLESLHAHDAVAMASKGIENGFRAQFD